jgi:thiamine biosynthesis lipoprotein
VVTLSAYGISSAELNDILNTCAAYEALLSKTIPGSDVYKINHANGRPVQVSAHTINILTAARNVSEKSGGAFDITIGPAVNLWDFAAASIPGEAALAAAAKLIDYTKVEINGKTARVPAGMEIDLGGIAKGYIADEIARLLMERGVTHGLLNFGGNVIVIGDKPGGTPWNVGLKDPDDLNNSFAVLPVAGCSVVTSGIYERGFDMDGVRYHHILDAATGRPIQNGLASVTIIGKSSMLCDALSTACFALGVEDGMTLLAVYDGYEAVFMDKDRKITATKNIAGDLIAVQ